MKPSNIAVRPQGTNNNSPNANQAEAAGLTFFEADPLQPGEVRLHSWMLYTPHAPVLDSTGEHIKRNVIIVTYCQRTFLHEISVLCPGLGL